MAKSKITEWLEEDKLILLEGWARDGLTEEQIAKNIGVSVKTLYNWKEKELPILQAIKKGKEVVDFEVENALLKKALGYTETLNKQRVTKDGNIVDIEEDVHIAPDSTALIFWLKNRQPKKWRDKVELTSDDEKMKEINKNISNIANLINNPQKNRNEEDVQ